MSLRGKSTFLPTSSPCLPDPGEGERDGVQAKVSERQRQEHHVATNGIPLLQTLLGDGLMTLADATQVADLTEEEQNAAAHRFVMDYGKEVLEASRPLG